MRRRGPGWQNYMASSGRSCRLFEGLSFMRQTKERARKHTDFLVNPFRFTKQLLGQKHSGHLSSSKEGMNKRNTFSDAAPGEAQSSHQSWRNPKRVSTHDCTLKDTASIRVTNQELEGWLTADDNQHPTQDLVAIVGVRRSPGYYWGA